MGEPRKTLAVSSDKGKTRQKLTALLEFESATSLYWNVNPRPDCYIYDRLLHSLKMSGHLDVLKKIISMADRSFPTRVPRDQTDGMSQKALQWLTDNNILLVVNDYEYGLVDEFLRIRLLLDSAGENPRDMSNRILSFTALQYYPTRPERDRLDFDYYEEELRRESFERSIRQWDRGKDPFEE
jgi:hypothetical protein